MSPIHLTFNTALRRHWPEYVIEACELGLFMISASVFAILLFRPDSGAAHIINSDLARRALMGLAMGLTAIAIIYSPLGRRSGAHMNPAVTLTFWRLGKMSGWDALLYVVFQFLGGVIGMLVASLLLSRWLAHSSVHYVTTNPGDDGAIGLLFAWLGEFVIALFMMLVVLNSSNRRRLAPFTGLFAGGLVVLWIVFEAPISGMSMNPARSFGSAYAAGLSSSAASGLWIYFTAPPLAMLAGAELYLRCGRIRRVYCAKMHHPRRGACIFRCEFGELMNASRETAQRETNNGVVASKPAQTRRSACACTPTRDAVTVAASDRLPDREPVLAAPLGQETLHFG